MFTHIARKPATCWTTNCIDNFTYKKGIGNGNFHIQFINRCASEDIVSSIIRNLLNVDSSYSKYWCTSSYWIPKSVSRKVLPMIIVLRN